MQTTEKAMAMPLRLPGLEKSGVTPGGGGIAGPLRIASCMALGRWGNFIITSMILEYNSSWQRAEKNSLVRQRKSKAQQQRGWVYEGEVGKKK